MSRIEPEIRNKLMKWLNLNKSQLYTYIQRVIAETNLDRRLAALKLAADNGISIQKYLSSDDRATMRGFSASHAVITNSNSLSKSIVRIQKQKGPLKIEIDFVSDKRLVKILQRDIYELSAIYSLGANKVAKACMVLSGSVAEAVLLSQLKKKQKAAIRAKQGLSNPTSINLEKWDLFEMVEVAIHMSPSLLSSDVESGANQLRQWRNLIHPGRELRDTRSKSIKPSPARAESAIAFLKLIVEELSPKK